MNKFLLTKLFFLSLFSVSILNSKAEVLDKIEPNIVETSIAKDSVNTPQEPKCYWDSKGLFERVTAENYPDLHARIKCISEKVNIKEPIVYILDATKNGIIYPPHYNAFAFNGFPFSLAKPFGGVMIIGKGLLREMDPKELDFIIAHEMGHLKNKQVVTMSALIAASMYLNLKNGIELNNDRSLSNLAKFIITNVITRITTKKTMLAFEKDADLTALSACKDKDLASSALTRLHELIDKYWPGIFKKAEDHNKKTFNLLKSHPDLDERIAYIQAAEIK